ncbi:MAG: hypothetical protein B7Z80_11650 [Rhodospirillales bacterium 20-64-7]|nr:MAG: hypothetical protein B7Z80_11650 [Rhodospirillales bacterium 20-64-7]HQT76062.1 hypothetical protein [Rhodopila sp.]
MANVLGESIFATAPNGASVPDSITAADGSVWVVWGNHASASAPPGTSGNSLIVEYNKQGGVENTYTVGGHVDGLKLDPKTGNVWVLQNEDGNSTLSFIDPATKQLSTPLKYGSGYMYGANSPRGVDDVAFQKSTVFISQTNPANPGDPVVSELLNGNAPFGTLQTQAILRLGDTGTNLNTGATNQPLPVSDPDSLKTLPDGSLILTSEADKAYTFIHHPGTPQQTESFFTLPSSAGTPDDAVMTRAKAGTFYISSSGSNQVIALKVNDINPQDLYASVGTNFDQINVKTGAITPLLTNLSGAAGILFEPSHQGGGHLLSDTHGTSSHWATGKA